MDRRLDGRTLRIIERKGEIRRKVSDRKKREERERKEREGERGERKVQNVREKRERDI